MSLQCEHSLHSQSFKHSDLTGIWGAKIVCPACESDKTLMICGLWLENLQNKQLNLYCPKCNYVPKDYTEAVKKVWKMSD